MLGNALWSKFQQRLVHSYAIKKHPNVSLPSIKITGIPLDAIDTYFGNMRTSYQTDPNKLPSRIGWINYQHFNLNIMQPKLRSPITDENEFNVGFIMGKKAMSKHAFLRNRARRRLRSAVADLLGLESEIWWKGFDFLFTGTMTLIAVNYKDLLKDMKMALEFSKSKISEVKQMEMRRSQMPRSRIKNSPNWHHRNS